MTRARTRWTLAGVGLLALSAMPLVRYYLVDGPPETWQLDLEVYRAAAEAVIGGRSVYDLLTPAPQFLPFTYPPFAALAALPLALVPFAVAGWAWTVAQLAMLWFTVGLAFAPLLNRCGVRAGLVQGALAAGGVWLLPVSEGVRFGQVNAAIVLLCLADAARRCRPQEPGTGRAWFPQGSLTGIAVAIKLTPGVFWLHWAVARRWRTLGVSVVATLAATGVTALVLPGETIAYFTGALLDSGRVGPNAGTANQSIRGALLRVGPDGTAGTLMWTALVVLVLVGGLTLSSRLDRLGDPVATVAAVGLVAFLVSPVSWVHHLHWGVVVIGAMLGDGRRPARVAAATAAAVLLWCRLPWWGVRLLDDALAPRWIGRLAQNSYPILAVLALAALWWLVVRPTADREPDRELTGSGHV